MPIYEYTADDADGQPTSGRLDAESVDAARQELAARGWTLRTLQPLRAADELAEFPAEPGAAAARSPLALLAGIRALAAELPARSGRAAIVELAERLERGEPAPTAVAAVESRLPRPLRSLVQQGVDRGRLAGLVEFYLEYARQSADLRRAIWQALAYPLVLGVCLLSIGGFLLVGIVPLFTHIFEDFDTELPGLTLALVSFSRACQQHGLVLLLTFAGLAATVWLTARLLGGRLGVQHLLRSIPLLGAIWRSASLSGFCQMLATLVEARVPLPAALQAAADATDDYRLAQGARRAALSVIQGVEPAAAVVQSRLLPRELAAVFRWTSRPDDFVESLRAAGEIYGARSRVYSNSLTFLLEPALVFLLAIGVGLVVIALFLPLVKLLNDLS